MLFGLFILELIYLRSVRPQPSDAYTLWGGKYLPVHLLVNIGIGDRHHAGNRIPLPFSVTRVVVVGVHHPAFYSSG